MKWFFNLLLVLTFLLLSGCGDSSVQDYSEGWRYGRLVKVSEAKGLALKTTEGQLMLGYESSVVANISSSDNSVSVSYSNPWEYSQNTDKVDTVMSNYVGKYVVLGYEGKYGSGTHSTPYRVQSMSFPRNEYPKYFDSNRSFSVERVEGQYSSGVRYGRIVKLSKKGNVKKTWEATLQLGDSGNFFVPVSVRSDEMARFLKLCLFSGMTYKFYYEQDVVEVVYDTDYNLFKVELP